MAETSTSYVPGAEEANRVYQESLKNLMNSLDARKNQLFDPVLLAMAQGFGAPTKTGSFFESAGNAAGALNAAQQEQLKQDQALAAAKFDIAGKSLEMERQRLADEAFQRLAERYAGGQQPPAAPPAAGPLSAAQPVLSDTEATTIPVRPLSPIGQPQPPLGVPSAPQGGLPVSDKPPGYENVEGIPIAPPNPAIATGFDILQMGRFDKSKSKADLLKEAQEAETRRYRDRENGVMDLRTGMYYVSPAGPMVEKQIYGQEGTYKVNPNTSAMLDYFASKNDPRYWDLAKQVVQGPTRVPKPSETTAPSAVNPPADVSAAVSPNVSTTTTPSITQTAAPAPSTGLQSEQALKAQAAAQTKTAEIEAQKAAEQSAAFRSEIIENAKNASNEISLGKQFKAYADDPKFDKMIGILHQPGVVAMVGKLAEEGAGVGTHRIGLQGIQDVLTRYAADNDLDLAKLSRFTQLGIQMQLAGNKLFGNRVTNYEERILGKTIITPEENAATARMKADAMIARAEFNISVANSFAKSKMTAPDYFTNEKSPYFKLLNNYTDRLIDINSGKTLVPTETAPKKGKPKDLDAARKAVEELLGGKP